LKSHADLLKSIATNEYQPFMYFKTSDNHLYKAQIDKQKILTYQDNNSLFLLHELSKLGKNGFYSEWEEIKKTLIRIATIAAVSGVGKTHLCFEVLCHVFGLYFIVIE